MIASGIGSHNVFANYAALAGHVTMEDHITMSSYSAVHQHCFVGMHSFVTKATYATKDVLPFIIIGGINPSTFGINTVGLKRNGYTSETIDNLRRAYKIIFRRGLTSLKAQEALLEYTSDCPEILRMIDVMKNSKRGIVR